MDHIAAAQEQIVTERVRRKLNEVNTAAQTHLSGIQDHVNFNLQQAYFKCAYQCFDRSRTQDQINNCVEHCSVPVMQAQNLVETEMAKFQVIYEDLPSNLCAFRHYIEKREAQNSSGACDQVTCPDVETSASNNDSCTDNCVQDGTEVDYERPQSSRQRPRVPGLQRDRGSERRAFKLHFVVRSRGIYANEKATPQARKG